MSRMTEGSIQAEAPVSPFAIDRPTETTAETSRILTRRSSNCLITSFQKGVPFSGGISFLPCNWRDLRTAESSRPRPASTWNAARTSATSLAWASSMIDRLQCDPSRVAQDESKDLARSKSRRN